MSRSRRTIHAALAGLVTAAALVWVARGLDFRSLGDALAEANWVLVLAISLPCFLLNVALRARRWQYLTRPVGDLGFGAHFRAVWVGFALNNVLPFRAGEVARCVYLAREGEVRVPTVMGTVLVERLLDVAALGLLAALFLGLRGASVLGLEGTTLTTYLPAFFIAPAVILAVLPSLTRARAEGIVGWLARPLGSRVRLAITQFAGDAAAGCAVLRDLRTLAPVSLLTVACWLSSVPPLWSALMSVDGAPGAIASGSSMDAAVAMTIWIAGGVALPAAPGFVGPYHAACWLALKPYGVPKGLAVAVGTVAHGVFWIGTTLPGLGALWVRGRPLSESLGGVRQSE